MAAETFTSIDALRQLGDFDASISFLERQRQKGGKEYYDIGSQKSSWSDPALDDSWWTAVGIPGGFKELGVADVPSLCWFRKESTLPDSPSSRVAPASTGQHRDPDTNDTIQEIAAYETSMDSNSRNQTVK